jgi:pyruvate dehydrogenase E2 component (dihydrolipoamide acetyltransferase)
MQAPVSATARPASAPKGASTFAQGASADRSARQASLPSAPGLTKPWSAAEARELRLSPVVRKIAREHHIDVRNIAGSGEGGRVTKNDILAYIDAGAPASASPAPGGATAGQASHAGAPLLAPNPAAIAGLDPSKYERTPMSVMRRKIAEHMVMSRRVSPHVHSAFEIDFTKVDEIRKAKKAEFEKAGGKLTYMSFITKACAEALKNVPIVNASVDGTDIIYKKDINIGVAVALEWGLIVPVVKNADTMSLLEISKAIADLAARAREKKLKPEDVQGGTFTITNPGVFGALFGMAIISQPQVAIVGVGAVEKRPVVIDDAITIRLRAYLTIGYDHRVIDGAIADEFMQVVKKMLENWDSANA